MVSRLLVPIDARIPAESRGSKGDSAVTMRRSSLIPKRLIPVDAKLAAFPEPLSGTAANAGPPHLMVPKFLVPADAKIGAVAGEGARSAIPVPEDVFKDALLGKAPIGHERSAAEWMLSLAVHAAIVVAVMIVPLFYTQTIDLNHMQLTFLVAPPTPAPPPPPPPPMAVSAAQRPRKMNLTQAKLTMPTAIPKTVRSLPSTPDFSSDSIAGGVPGGVIGGVPGGQIGGVLGGLVADAGVPPPPPPPSSLAPAAPSGPLHVGGQVKAPARFISHSPHTLCWHGNREWRVKYKSTQSSTSAETSSRCMPSVGPDCSSTPRSRPSACGSTSRPI